MRAHPGRGRTMVGLIAALAVVPAAFVTMSTATASPRPSVAAATTAVTVELTSVSPTVATGKGSVSVTGTVRNPGDAPVPLGSIRLVRGTGDPDTPAAVTAWVEATERADGETIATAKAPKTLAPGRSAAFTLTVTSPTALTPEPYAVLPVAIEAAGTSLHTFLAVQRTKEYRPLGLAVLLPLTLPAEPELWSDDPTARVSAWTRAVGPGSAIAELVAGSTGAPVGWAMDPLLLTTATWTDPEAPEATPSATPSVTASGTASNGAASPTASPSASTAPAPDPVDVALPPGRALSAAEASIRTESALRLRELARTHRATLLPCGDPDVSALATTKVKPQVREQVACAATAAKALGLDASISWPVDQRFNPARAGAVADLYDPTAAQIVSRQSVTPAGDGDLASQTTTAGLRLLTQDEVLGDLLAGASAPAERPVATQAFLAQTMALLNLAPGTDRTVLVAPPRGLVVDAASLQSFLTSLTRVPWLTPRGVDGSMADAAEATVGRASGATKPAASPLTAQATDGLIRLGAEVAAITTIRGDGSELLARSDDVLRSLRASSWRGHAAEWEKLRSGIAEVIPETRDAVTVADQNVTFLADKGRMQVTVLNDLDVSVEDLTLTLTPGNPRLRIDTSPLPIRIGAKSRTTSSVEATALAAGQVALTAQLAGPDGTPIGRPTVLTVRVSPTGDWIYWGLGGLAALILGAGLWRNQVTRAGAKGGRDVEPPAAIIVGEDGEAMDDLHDHVTDHARRPVPPEQS